MPQRCTDEQQDEARYREQRVGHSHRESVDHPPTPCGRGADERTDGRGQHGSDDAHREREPSREHHAYEEISAEAISAEQVKFTTNISSEWWNQSQGQHIADGQRVASRQQRDDDCS